MITRWILTDLSAATLPQGIQIQRTYVVGNPPQLLALAVFSTEQELTDAKSVLTVFPHHAHKVSKISDKAKKAISAHSRMNVAADATVLDVLSDLVAASGFEFEV